MAERTALATERAVLSEMRSARGAAAASDRTGADAKIQALQTRITRRETRLSQLESTPRCSPA